MSVHRLCSTFLEVKVTNILSKQCNFSFVYCALRIKLILQKRNNLENLCCKETSIFFFLFVDGESFSKSVKQSRIIHQAFSSFLYNSGTQASECPYSIGGAWVAQSVEHPTMAQVMISACGFQPVLGSVLTAQSLESALDSVFPSVRPLLSLCLCLSKINKH